MHRDPAGATDRFQGRSRVVASSVLGKRVWIFPRGRVLHPSQRARSMNFAACLQPLREPPGRLRHVIGRGRGAVDNILEKWRILKQRRVPMMWEETGHVWVVTRGSATGHDVRGGRIRSKTVVPYAPRTGADYPRHACHPQVHRCDATVLSLKKLMQ